MKKIILVGLVSIVFSGCKTLPNIQCTESNVAVGARYNDEWIGIDGIFKTKEICFGDDGIIYWKYRQDWDKN